MSERADLERLVRELHAARIEGDLGRLCALFTPQARLHIVGASDGKPLLINAEGEEDIRTWLAMLVKSFEMTDYQLLEVLVDGAHASVHWRVRIHSKVTGHVVPTEVVDLIETRGERISAHTQLFVAAL